MLLRFLNWNGACLVVAMATPLKPPLAVLVETSGGSCELLIGVLVSGIGDRQRGQELS